MEEWGHVGRLSHDEGKGKYRRRERGQTGGQGIDECPSGSLLSFPESQRAGGGVGVLSEGRINRSPSQAFLFQGISSMKLQIQSFNLSEFVSY